MSVKKNEKSKIRIIFVLLIYILIGLFGKLSEGTNTVLEKGFEYNYRNHDVEFYQKSKMVFDVKLYGAIGDGKTDDTLAIQLAIDAAKEKGGGVIFFPEGVYIVTTVNIEENMMYEGRNATIKRPDYLTKEIGLRDAKWVRTFTNQKSKYLGEKDSNYLIIKNLTFDGSCKTQGYYKKYELEQAALVFLTGDKKGKGRLRAIIENCAFKNGVGDAVHAFVNTDVTMINCSAEDVFRGAFVLTGGNSKAYIKNLLTKGQENPTGIDVEVDTAGYGGSYKVELILDGLQLKDGDFDVAVKEGSTVFGRNIDAKAPFNLYAKNSTVELNDSSFEILPGNRILYPKNVIFNKCTFYAVTEGNEKEKNATGAPFVKWNTAGTKEKNQSLTFNQCSFVVREGKKRENYTYFAIMTGWDAAEFNNVLNVSGGNISKDFDVGIGMRYRGGTWRINDVEIDALLPFKWTGFKDDYGNAYARINLKGLKINSEKYMHIGGNKYGTKNIINHEDVIIEATTNYVTSDFGLKGNTFTGKRTIIGSEPPTSKTHGFPGDVYRQKDLKEEWICTRAGFYNTRSGKNESSEWEPIPR